MKKQAIAFFCTTILFFSFFNQINGQNDSTNNHINKKEIKKKGWSLSGIPAIAFDSDVGFRYGAVVNLYDYGDTIYPNYQQSIGLEWTNSTKGSGSNIINYDTKTLIPSIRVTTELAYLTEKALDFYGTNGYDAVYNHDLEDEQSDSYLSRVFYRVDRKLFKIKTDFQGNLPFSVKGFKWYGGYSLYHVKLDTVDVNHLNKGKSESEKLKYVGGGLYQQYITNGLIPDGEQYGGTNHLFRLGIVFDNRDKETNPNKGIWSDAQIIIAPQMSINDGAFAKIALTLRQYQSIVPKRLTLASRVSYQARIWGKTPYYMLPFVFNVPPGLDRDGLGGARTLRGILRNRVIGEDFIYSNFELRYKVASIVLFKQNLYGMFVPFYDAGYITRKYTFANNNNLSQAQTINNSFADNLHQSAGFAAYCVVNENFVLAGTLGKALDKRDGTIGVYINVGMLF